MSGFLYDVTLRRLTKVSFNLSQIKRVDLAELLDLWAAYFIGILLFLFIYLFLEQTNVISKELFAICGLTLLYIGRIITKMEGSFYGRLHFTALFASPLILIYLRIISNAGGNFSPLASELSIQSLKNIIISFFGMALQYVNMVLDTSQGTPLIVIAFLGSIGIAFIGEWYLSNLPPKIKSNLCVSDKFPSKFKAITSIKSDECKIDFIKKEMFGNKKFGIQAPDNPDTIVSIKGVTKSLGIIKFTSESIIMQYDLCTDPENSKIDYRFLIAPEKMALNSFENAINDLPYGIFSNNKLRSGLTDDFVEEYKDNHSCMADLVKKRMIRVKEYDFCGVPFLITENKSGYRRLLFLVKDKGIIGDRVGLYTDDQYLIEAFEDIFKNTWAMISQKHEIR